MSFIEGNLSAKLRIRPLGLTCPPGALLGALVRRPYPAVLDSTALHESYGRYTVLGCCPLEVLTLSNDLLTSAAGEVLAEGRAFWQEMKKAFDAVRLPVRPATVNTASFRWRRSVQDGGLTS